MSRPRPPNARQSLSGQETSTTEGEAATSTLTTRRRLHYVDFGRLESFLQNRLREAQDPRPIVELQTPKVAGVVATSPSAMTTSTAVRSGTAVRATETATQTATATSMATNSTASNHRRRGWLRRANRARRRFANRLARVLAGCIDADEDSSSNDCGSVADVAVKADGLLHGGVELRNQLPQSRRQRCNNATGPSADRVTGVSPTRESAPTRSSVLTLQTTSAHCVGAKIRAQERNASAARQSTLENSRHCDVDAVSNARTLSLRPVSSGSPRSVATTVTALSNSTRPAVSMPSSSSARSRQSADKRSKSAQKFSRAVDDQTVLLSDAEAVEETHEPSHNRERHNSNFSNSKSKSAKAKTSVKAANIDEAMVKTYIGKATVAGGAGGIIKDSRRRQSKGENEEDTNERANRPTAKRPDKWKQKRGPSSFKKQAVAKSKAMPRKKQAKGYKGKSASTVTSNTGRLVTLTSEGLAWSDDMASLKNPTLRAQLRRPGAVERVPPDRLLEDYIHDPPRSVALRRNIECPLVPLMTYKTDKKGELFYSVVQMCHMCRKDVCPKCRRSLCAFCTAITCSDCRMLLHQMVAITKAEGWRNFRQRKQAGHGSAGGQVVPAANSRQSQPYCHSCEKPICLVCADNLAMILPTNERCVQHSQSGSIYEDLCPWCGRTICRECRRSSCFACTKAFQCACISNCPCDHRGAVLSG